MLARVEPVRDQYQMIRTGETPESVLTREKWTNNVFSVGCAVRTKSAYPTVRTAHPTQRFIVFEWQTMKGQHTFSPVSPNGQDSTFSRLDAMLKV
jgi:hypothetical protein